MGRHVHLHMDLTDHEAALIREAAKLSRVRPSYYVLDRVMRAAECEIAEYVQMRAGDERPEDIDTASQQEASSGTGGGGSGGGPSASEDDDDTEENRRSRLARYRQKTRRSFRVAPLG